MNASIEWIPLRIADAGRMASAGLIAGGEKKARDAIRGLLRPDTRHRCAFAGYVPDDPFPRCVALVTVIDPDARRGIIRWIDRVEMEPDVLKGFLLDLVGIAFFQIGLHRLEMSVPVGDEQLCEAASGIGMWREGMLHNAAFNGRLHEDAWSHVMLRPQYSLRGYGFIPFPKGLVTVLGEEAQVEQIGFIHNEEWPSDPYLQECLAYRGYLDREGRVVNRPDPATAAQDIAPIPEEVAVACRQLEEYFAHRRSTFDIRTAWPAHASAFQRRVWDILGGIGYGHVWTYEDVAAELVEGSREEARKMTRAVGSACAANPLAIVVPCHRVIGKDGKLTGFSGGVDIKEHLLAHEWIVPDTEAGKEEPPQ